MMAGPASSCSVTKCTVAPCFASRASRARRCVWRPGNFGSSEGWMFRIRPAIALDELRRQDAHEAGEHDQRRRVLFDGGGQFAVVSRSIGRRGRISSPSGHAQFARHGEPGCCRLVGQHAQPPRSPWPRPGCVRPARACCCRAPRSVRQSARDAVVVRQSRHRGCRSAPRRSAAQPDRHRANRHRPVGICAAT